MSEQERKVRDEAAEKPAVAPPAGPAQTEDAEHPVSVMGRVGRAVSSFDETLSDRVPDAIEDAGKRAADSTRKGVQSGLWHNYAFLAVLALVSITVLVLLLRGCSTGGPL